MPPMTLPSSPHPVTSDTWLIPTLAPDPAGSGVIGAHSLVIRGAEPVIVDTGCLLVRDDWMAKAFSVVEPADVRWIFLSHDDHDHLGNLDAVLDACPNATVIASFPIVGRLMGDVEFPFERMRWANPGDTIDAGDRQLALVRPPAFDSPATRGLYDTATKVMWAVDSFGALVQGEVYEAADADPALYEFSFAMLNQLNTPWLEWVDVDRYTAHVRATSALDIAAVASAHGPILRGAQIDDAFRRTLDLANQPPVPVPGQAELDAMLAALAA